MSVVIEDMEMPKTCSDCIFWYVGYTNAGVKQRYCVPTQRPQPEREIRPDWCPLMETEVL